MEDTGPTNLIDTAFFDQCTYGIDVRPLEYRQTSALPAACP